MTSNEMLRSVAACPSCRGSLNSAWSCDHCGQEYGVIDGRPALMLGSKAQSTKQNVVVQSQSRERTQHRRTGLRGLADKIRTASNAKLFADDRTQVQLLANAVVDTIPAGLPVVDVGACEQYYRKELDRLGPVLALDVAPYTATDVIADAHSLPFRDNSVGAIVVIEVLEHLKRPWKFFAEASRVLAKGGVVVGVAPQYCPTHGFPDDYFRYTRSGLTTLGESEGLQVEAMWPVGGHWATLLHWYWANYARENPMRKVPGVGVLYHAWFQGLAKVLDTFDGTAGRGAVPPQHEHQDHMGWSFVFRKPL